MRSPKRFQVNKNHIFSRQNAMKITKQCSSYYIKQKQLHYVEAFVVMLKHYRLIKAAAVHITKWRYFYIVLMQWNIRNIMTSMSDVVNLDLLELFSRVIFQMKRERNILLVAYISIIFYGWNNRRWHGQFIGLTSFNQYWIILSWETYEMTVEMAIILWLPVKYFDAAIQTWDMHFMGIAICLNS